MSRRGGKGGRTDHASPAFFSVILALNLVMFVGIAVLEYRAFKLAELDSHKAGLEIDIAEPEVVGEGTASLYRMTTILVRRMYAEGRAAFEKCELCHALKTTVPNYGPDLTCVGGRRIADTDAPANETYRFSQALIRKSEEVGVWSLPNLEAFIDDPASFQVGTRMPFPGLNHVSDGNDKPQKLLRDVVQFLYWKCAGYPDFEELRVVQVKQNGSCSEKSLAEGLKDVAPDQSLAEVRKGFDDKTDFYLMPKPLPECGG